MRAEGREGVAIRKCRKDLTSAETELRGIFWIGALLLSYAVIRKMERLHGELLTFNRVNLVRFKDERRRGGEDAPCGAHPKFR